MIDSLNNLAHSLPRLTKAVQIIGLLMICSAVVFVVADDSRSLYTRSLYVILNLGALATLVVTELLKDRLDETHVEILARRQDLYEKCAQIIRTANMYIFDTTWGRFPAEPIESEREGREKYRKERERAASERGIDCRELFTDDPRRRERILESFAMQDDRNVKYECALLPSELNKISLLDFMVVDDKHVFISHVARDLCNYETQYVYVRSTILAKLFAHYFRDCFLAAERNSDDVRRLLENKETQC